MRGQERALAAKPRESRNDLPENYASVCHLSVICLPPFPPLHHPREAAGLLGPSVPGPSDFRGSSHTEEGACNMLLGNKNVA